MTYKETYEQLMESIVGDKAIERYTKEDIL